MPYGNYWLTIDPIKRRMALASGSVSPGFTGTIASIDTGKRTVDLWVQNSVNTLKNIPYVSDTGGTPPWLIVQAAVYIRHARGNKFRYEVEGPALLIPTATPGGASPSPPLGTESDTTISVGGSITNGYQSANPAMSVAITSGHVRLNGVNTQLSVAKVGENLGAKLTGQTITTMLVGSGHKVGNTHLYSPIDAAETLASGDSRVDSIELGQDAVFDYIKGTAAVSPQRTTLQANHLLIASVLVKPGVTKITGDDINLAQSTVYALTPFPQAMSIVPGDIDSPKGILIRVYRSGQPSSNHVVTASFVCGEGRVDPLSTVTNSNGFASFTYTREAGTTESAEIRFEEHLSNSKIDVVVTNLDANDIPLECT